MQDGKDGSAGSRPIRNGILQRNYESLVAPTKSSSQRMQFNASLHTPRGRPALFEDPDFPANDRSLYWKHRPATWPITWMRPYDICPHPKFRCAEAGWTNLEPGGLGDTWLLSAVTCLRRTSYLFERVVPVDQDFELGYCGHFRFRFWHFGEWVDVIIDDRLPTHAGQLVTLHSSNSSEFWPALFEKAYAKFHGCYEQLTYGCTTQALQDLTGGIVQNFHLSSQDRYLTIQLLSSALPRATLLSASIHTTNRKQLRLRHGLMTRLSYLVTGLIRVHPRNSEILLVRLRTIGGIGGWTGPWSERSWEWDNMKEWQQNPLTINANEFWMSFEDFAKNFTHLDVVHIGPDDWMAERYLHSRKPWRAVIARRRWRAGYNAGGGPDHIETVTSNPQFRVQIPHTGLPKCHVVVSVMQFYDPTSNSSDRKTRFPLHPIGFAVYEVPFSTARVTAAFAAQNRPLDVTNHCAARETVTFFTLRPGDYVVIPCMRNPDCETRFVLRIFTDEQSTIWEVNDDNLILQSIPIENGEDNFRMLREGRAILAKFTTKFPPEIDAHGLQKILRLYWKTLLSLSEKPSLELSRAFVMLRDSCISGRISLSDVPGIMRTAHLWQSAFHKFEETGTGRTSSYHLRSLLWEAGVSVSNKVLECLVLRFVKNSVLTSDTFLRAMVRIHVAHERFKNLNNRCKSNPLSLEEVILMTIYA